MDKNTLRKALRKVILYSDNLDNIIDAELFDNTLTEEQLVSSILDEIVNDELLTVINEKLCLLPNISFSYNNYNLIDNVVEDENCIGHGVTLVSKVFNEPVAFIGENWNLSNTFAKYEYNTSLCSYINNDGNWLFAYRHSISIPSFDTNDSSIIIETFEPTTDDSHYGLEEIQDYLPQKFNGLLWNFDY